ncbi:uncharacterized protein LOC116293984 [Actinia tenebrosa]|uniref:Uncharacterized protein LOC116293984 n=1 Tax=Actinia tenebrosa TaxID=6105 RepID=A0A6P8HLR8_ACTTE|nr:uncharacterized protein LOC116293984 [Actinia tenebrosa]
MHKRNVLSGAFALPGLAKDSQKSTPRDRISRKRQDIDQYAVEIETPKTAKAFAKGTTKTKQTEDDSSCLVDRRGEFLPQPNNGRLKHLTKSRPKSPARRPGNNTRRNRSRSPDLRRDSFDYTLGLNNNTESETTYGKQATGEAEKKYSNSLNKNSNYASRKSNVTKQVVVKDLNLSANTMASNGAVSSGFDVYSKERVSSNIYNRKDYDSESSQQEFNSYSDEDLGDMLIGDYVDSDESVSDNIKPPLPCTPPPLDEEIVTQNEKDNSFSGTRSPKVESYKALVDKTNSSDNIKEDISKNIRSNYSCNDTNNANNDMHQSKTSSINDSSIMSKSNTTLLSGQSGSTNSTVMQSISQSSHRRRRFKPVSVDDVITESDTLLKTVSFRTDSNDSEKANRTFPGNYSEILSFESGSSSSSGYKREIDWGLGTGPLNTSLSESTLKRGTIFEKFLKKKEREPDEHQSKQGVDSSAKGPFVTTEVDGKLGLNSDNMLSNNLSVSLKRSDGRAIAKVQENNSYIRTEENNSYTNSGKQMINKQNYDENNENESTYDTDGYVTNIIDYADDVDDDINGDDEDDNHHSHIIKGTTDHLMLDSCQVQSHFDNDKDSSANTSDVGSVSSASIEDGEDMTDTFDYTTERRHFNGVCSPGEILLDKESHDNNSLHTTQGLYVPPRWAENEDITEYSPERVNRDRNDSDDDDEGRDEKLETEDLQDDVDNMYSDNEDYVQNAGNESLNYLNQDLDQDDVIYPPHLFNEEHETTNDEDEDLYEPPPMFASDEENDELDFDSIPPPLTMSPLMPTPSKKVMPFHKIPLVDWTEDDALHWLQHVGLGHFKEQFKAHHVDGKTLKNINFQLLEEIGISAPDERELVLSEIYELDNPSEEEHLEAEIQDALETASEQDKEKILAVLTALRSPTLNHSMEFPKQQSPQESGSPMDSDPGYHMSSDATSLASSVTASDEHTRTNVTPSHSQHSDLHSASGYGQGQEDTRKEGQKEAVQHKKTKEKKKKKSKTNKKEKKSISKFWDSLSISHKSSKLTKLFGSKKLNPAMQYLLQSGPQGIVRVYPTALSGQTKYCSFMVSMTTTSAQVVRMVLDKYDVVADPLRYYLCEIGLGKGGVNQVLEEGGCPLTWQCRWNDPEKFRFEMRSRDEGSVRMLFEMEEYKGDLDYRSIAVSSRTPCKDVLPLIIKKYDLPGNVEDYQLMEVSEDNEDDRRVVTDHVCPLRLQMAWNEPDHVFRLVRKHVTPVTSAHSYVEDQEETQEHPSPSLPRTNSNASSLRENYYETDSTDHQDNTSEEALPAINQELEEVVMEVQDKISGQLTPHGNVSRTRGHSNTVDAQVEELKRKDAELQLKEKEIQDLKRERDELLEKENELLVWRLRNNELVEREEEVEKLQMSFAEKENQELLKKESELNDSRSQCTQLLVRKKEMEEVEQQQQEELEELRQRVREGNEELQLRDREIEKLYARNNELVGREKELEENMKDFMKLKMELENKNESSTSLSKQEELENKIKDLLLVNESLQNQLDEAMNERLTEEKNTKETLQLQERLVKAESEKKELQQKLEELQRRNLLLERGAKLIDSMREENKALVAKAKEMDEMKRNIIRLTSRLREADNLRLNQGELDDMKLRISICEAEKQQLQSRVEEVERQNGNLREDLREADQLRKENRSLREKVNELEDVRTHVKTLRKEIQEGEVLRENLLKVQGTEKSLTKELKSKEALLKQKEEKCEQQEKKIRHMTDAMKKMETKFQEQDQQRETLSRLLNIIKETDPGLLKTLHKSLHTSDTQPQQQPGEGEQDEEDEEDEEWC